MGNQSANYNDLDDIQLDGLQFESQDNDLVDSLFGFPYVESPEDDIFIIGNENLSFSDFNVSPENPPLGDCPPPLNLSSEVSDSILNVSIFSNRQVLAVKKSFIEYLSELNNGFEKIQKGQMVQAREILVESLGISNENFESVIQGIQSRASSPSDTENNLLMP